MANSIRFVLALHNHQPVGNFDNVIEQAYRESYLPFLDVFTHYASLRFALHTSGCLMQWLDVNHPEYVDRLRQLVAEGRLEIIGGPLEEPILPMLPTRDRIGQIRRYSEWLERRLGTTVRGAWIPERVWEQSLTRDLVAAGIEYIILDDFHFRCAGLTNEQLHGYYLTEDDGHLLKVFPGSERLRYTIPFAEPEETIRHLSELAAARPDSVVVFGDDGEKFGTWPETHKHCYENRWLPRFLDLLAANQSWIQCTTLAEAADNMPPVGKIYLPDGSYREMTEWSLPAEQLVKYEQVTHDMEHDPRWPALRQFVQGGFWRNFKLKYPESDEMYCRMMMVSRRLAEMRLANGSAGLVDQARAELYKGQCNCSYWHGAFGGIYLPHLRHAVYNHLIRADNLLNEAEGRHGPWVEALADDFNLDARQEVQLANDRMLALVAPARGGQIYELDVRTICLNLLGTLSRRPEAYHRKVLAGGAQHEDSCASIHDRVVFKQAGLDQRIVYDSYQRKSLLDHFYNLDAPFEAVASGQAQELGDFLMAPYEARIRRNRNIVQLVLKRSGFAAGHCVRIVKSITLEAGLSTLEISYSLENLPLDRPLHFAVEFNFAGLPAQAENRYFYDGDHRRLGHLGAKLDLADVNGLGLADEWQGIGVGVKSSRPTSFWTFPIETVSQSEGGIELVHQSVAVFPHWYVQGDQQGRWNVSMTLSIDTSLAESRMAPPHVQAPIDLQMPAFGGDSFWQPGV
jgi:alpha-amylase